MEVEYRLITALDDVTSVDIVLLGEMAHGESSYCHLGFVPEKLLGIAARFASGDDSFFVMAYEGNKPVGVFVGDIDEYYFSHDMVATDFVWYVVPERRGSRIGIQLLDLFEGWALEKGASDVRIGQSTNITPEVFEGLLKKRGYKFIGTNYRMGT